MKKKPCIMIYCITSNDAHIKDLLLQKISDIVAQHYPNAIVSLEYYGDYWKWEGAKEITYGVSHITPIHVYEFIKIFPVKWEYSENMVHNVDFNKIYNLEEADWSKNCMPNEIFLIPEVTWTHIYTCED